MGRHRSGKPYGGGRSPRHGPRFLDTRGNPSLGIGVCARCGFKFPLHELQPDPNAPGIMVCAADRDDFDPYRMAPRQPDRYQLPFTRPDVEIADGTLPSPEWLTTNDPVEPFNPNDPPR